jgi:hypothetical protein
LHKNVQIIDGAINSTFDIFIVSEDQFSVIFPEGKNIAFLDDFPDLINNEIFWNNFYKQKAVKSEVKGIHGTLHLTGSDIDKEEFPNRKETDVTGSF